MANFDINVFMIARDKCFCRVKSDLFQRRRGTVQYRTVPGRASGDVMIIYYTDAIRRLYNILPRIRIFLIVQ